jgi:cell wall-associated NlpC family hydrolase
MSHEEQLRAAIVAEAREWLGTPYRWHGRVKGRQGGVDCAMLIAEVFSRTGAIKDPEVVSYSQQWHLHRSEELYLDAIGRFAHRIPGPPKAGDCAFFKFGRTFSHGAIVTDWPNIVHAPITAGMVVPDRADQEPLRSSQRIFFSLFQ